MEEKYFYVVYTEYEGSLGGAPYYTYHISYEKGFTLNDIISKSYKKKKKRYIMNTIEISKELYEKHTKPINWKEV
jgi:hypothetical protein